MTTVMNLINTSIIAASEWFYQVFHSSGMTEIYISFLFIVFSFRFLLKPVFGSSRGSDRARPSNNRGDNDE